VGATKVFDNFASFHKASGGKLWCIEKKKEKKKKEANSLNIKKSFPI